MTVSRKRIQVALNLPDVAPDLLHVASAIVQAMTGNPRFSSPSPSLAAVAAALADLDAAQVATLSRSQATVAARNAKQAVLAALLQRLKAYVQGIADDDPDQAAAIIESAGMSVKKKGSPARAPFAVRPGPNAGSVRLQVRSAGDKASYQWQWSTDGGKTWSSAPPSLQAETVIDGLPSASTVWFRGRAVTKDGAGEWSEPVSIVVP